MSRWCSLIGVIGIATLNACSIFGPEEERRIGKIRLDDPEPQVLVPDSTSVGASFAVTIWTSGDGCDRVGDTEVDGRPLFTQITPYDIRDISRDLCPSVLRSFLHEVSLRFNEVGTATVLVKARDQHGVPIELDYEVVVVQ